MAEMQSFSATMSNSQTSAAVAQQGSAGSSSGTGKTITGYFNFSGLNVLKGKTIKSVDFKTTFSKAGRNTTKTLTFTTPADFSFTTTVNAYGGNVNTATFTSGPLFELIQETIEGTGSVQLVMNNGETNRKYGSSVYYSANYLSINTASLEIIYEDSPPVYYYNGSSWVPAKIHYYNGSTWIESKAKFYNNGWPN